MEQMKRLNGVANTVVIYSVLRMRKINRFFFSDCVKMNVEGAARTRFNEMIQTFQ